MKGMVGEPQVAQVQGSQGGAPVAKEGTHNMPAPGEIDGSTSTKDGASDVSLTKAELAEIDRKKNPSKSEEMYDHLQNGESTDTSERARQQQAGGQTETPNNDAVVGKPVEYGSCCPCACFNIQNGAKHELFEPQGCCTCCGAGTSLCCGTGNNLKEILSWTTKKQLTKPGKIITLTVAAIVLCFGLYGLPHLEREFKIEWFIPAGRNARNRIFKFNSTFFIKGKHYTVSPRDLIHY